MIFSEMHLDRNVEGLGCNLNSSVGYAKGTRAE